MNSTPLDQPTLDCLPSIIRLDVLNFHYKHYLQDQVDLYNILPTIHVEGLSLNLSDGALYQSMEAKFEDLLDRPNQIETPFSFWELARSNMPTQLGESTDYKLDNSGSHLTVAFDKQILSQHPSYTKSVLVRDRFQMFRRDDGKPNLRYSITPYAYASIRVPAHDVSNGWENHHRAKRF